MWPESVDFLCNRCDYCVSRKNIRFCPKCGIKRKRLQDSLFVLACVAIGGEVILASIFVVFPIYALIQFWN